MQTLANFNFQGKRVLVRCDFNVAINNNIVTDDFRLKRSLETIWFLKRAGAKIILLSHLGRSEEQKQTVLGASNLSLKPVQKKLAELLREPVLFSKAVTGFWLQRKIRRLQPGQVLLLENLRLNKGEEGNDLDFAKELAKLGDIYVNEAFSVCHRQHASVALLPSFLPSAAGLELSRELDFLGKIRDNPERPFSVIIGGAKLESKIRFLSRFMQSADHLLVGGDIADVILSVKGITVGRLWPQADIVEKIQSLDLTNPKMHLPVDAVMASQRQGGYKREGALGTLRQDEEILDIGQDTIKKFGEIIKQSRTIFWSGPLGLIENKNFERGTVEIAKLVTQNEGALKVLGGGDTVDILNNYNLNEKFSFVSIGGGAMLAFLAGEIMPGLEALK